MIVSVSTNALQRRTYGFHAPHFFDPFTGILFPGQPLGFPLGISHAQVLTTAFAVADLVRLHGRLLTGSRGFGAEASTARNGFQRHNTSKRPIEFFHLVIDGSAHKGAVNPIRRLTHVHIGKLFRVKHLAHGHGIH